MQQSASREPSELAPSGQIDQVKVVGGKLRKMFWGRFPRFVVACSAALALVGCTSSQYAGIDLRPGRAPVELQNLARRALHDDPQAALELGIRLEEGWGVAADRDWAMILYRKAASGPRRSLLYRAPSPDRQLTLLHYRDGRGGLAEAAVRLDRLRRQKREEAADE